MCKPDILVHCPRYNTDMNAFGITTPFALDRGQLVLDALSHELGCELRGLMPRPLTHADLCLVHTQRYLDSLARAAVWCEIFGLQYQPKRPAATRSLPELLDDFKLKSGGTLLAAKLALKHGLAANLGAGYHHASADKGEGFCAINDIAIAIRSLQKQGAIERALVIDVDFHQGNGTASIFAGDHSVVTVSVHSAEAWPHKKQHSTIDVAIKFDQSAHYLPRLKVALDTALAQFNPDLCIFVQGSDAYEKDAATGGRLMKLTLEQLRQRDEYVIDVLANRGIPTALVFSGGYGPDAWRVHYNAVRHLLRRAWKLDQSGQPAAV